VFSFILIFPGSYTNCGKGIMPRNSHLQVQIFPEKIKSIKNIFSISLLWLKRLAFSISILFLLSIPFFFFVQGLNFLHKVFPFLLIWYVFRYCIVPITTWAYLFSAYVCRFLWVWFLVVLVVVSYCASNIFVHVCMSHCCRLETIGITFSPVLIKYFRLFVKQALKTHL